MNEITKFGVYKKKLQGVCDENDLVFSFNKDRYPITMTIKPTGGMDGQMSMMEDDHSYINPDATLVFAYGEDGLTWQTSETFTISETLFNKLKNYFKNMRDCWQRYFFREMMEHSSIPKDQLPQEQYEEPDDQDDPLDDLEELDEADIPSLEGDGLDDEA